VMQDIEDGVLDTGYDFGLHHISHLPFSMGFSHGMHPVQPVHMRDIATAAFNILHHPEYNNNGEVIDAVSEINTLPFMHFISALHPRFGDPSKSLLVILIPLEVAEAATKVFSTGHFQEYAVHFTRAQEERVKRGESDALCPQKFEQVLGREPIDVVGTLQKEKQEKDFVCAKPEYGKMVRGLFRNVRNHPSHAKNAAKGVLKGLSGIRVGRVEEKNNSTF